VKRHVSTGVTENMSEAVRRADENDIPSKPARFYNMRSKLLQKDGRFIIENLLKPTRVIENANDPAFTHDT
jgi:hypothetical protein